MFKRHEQFRNYFCCFLSKIIPQILRKCHAYSDEAGEAPTGTIESVTSLTDPVDYSVSQPHASVNYKRSTFYVACAI